MATREKKPRSVNSDSPTPSLGGGSDSAPSTPTSKGKGSRVSLSRQKSKQSQNANEDSVQSTDDISDMPAIEATSSSIGRPSSSSSSRTTRATKDESAEQANNSKEKEKDESKDSKDSKASSNRKTAEKKKKSIIGKGATVKTTVTALKKTTLMKRKTRPIVGKPVLGKKVIARKQINSKGKKEVTVTVKEEDSKNTNLRNGKPRATDSPVGKRKSVTPKDKSPKDATSDSVTVKVERRRSDSVSKCSDVTDASLLDTSSCKDEDDKKDETSLLELKRELMEEHETKTKILDKMAEAFNERKTPTVPLSKDDKKVRRSARQRKSTTRDKDDFVTPKLKAPVDIKAEPMDSEEPVAAPLCIDTETAMKETPSGELEKDSSLSPELVSEGVSEISVKEFYSEPAFLENNLGIEKDPKLGEIVQVQEKIKLDKESDSVVTANGSTSVMQEALPVVIKKEKVEPNESREDDRESVLLNSEQMEVGKLKEIIGIVETSELPPIVVIPKYECSGNESPASDGSNDVMATVSSKVESILKKIDSRSDSDGERPNKQNTQKAKVTGKETKPKSRNLKDKCKEDEKVKEEKLRQEKIRVEEKVREEKLRAELLIQEKQKKIHEDIIPQDDKVKKDQDVMNSSSVTPERIGKQVSPNHDDEVVSVVEKVLPSTTITTLSLTSADSHLVLSVTSTDPIDIVENTKIEPSIVTNTITLENLPAITLLKKESNQAKNDNVIENVQLKAELEILPIKEVVVAKGENFMTKDPELSLHIVPKSGETGATISEKSFTIEECTSPNSVIKIETDVKKDSANSAIFKETPAEIQEVKASDAVENREPIERVPQMNHAKTVEISSLSVTEDVLPVIDSNNPETSSVVGDETDDITKQKESHFKHLGLLTLQAASAEKQRRKELVLQKPTGGSGSGYSSSSSSGGKSSGKPCRNSESTGTLKTVIKLNRGEKRRARLPLKMTLQKGKGKGTEKDANGAGGNGETAFYIIQNENDHQNQSMPDAAGASQQARKAHSRSHTTDAVTLTEVVAETATKEVVQKALVIPEKASSFNVHPERLCQDQCFYCGGKFGLYDTPCHIAAMKSTERQQKILASEVKIKIDSCLCDACFRHVDRKTNCPSYRKKTEAKSLTSLAKMQSNTDSSHEDKQSHEDMVRSPTSITRESTETDTKDESAQSATIEDLEIVEERVHGSCYVQNCGANASHTIRRKWLLKMKKTISKIFEINLEQANVTSNLIPICDSHYELISHLMICAMCKRRLPKNHIYYIVNEIPQLERLIQEQGIAMKLGNSTLVVCKLCRYYANLLLKPPDAKSQKAQFIKNYNRRMLQFCEREKEQDQQEPSNAVAEPIRIISNPDIVISDGEEESTAILSMSDSVSLQRRRRHSQKSTEISIIDSNCSQMAELEEVTITPAPKLTTVPSVGVDSSIILDTTDASNEQAVASAEKRRKDDTLDMTKALKANPNISMRELFPGEEELAIHINIPFNTASTRTPEGWAKVTTTLQYDDATRALWEDLQKPYGNQSSFLRHLVLLEKYYRNGDLILSPQAKNNAATYSEAVQNRLRAFDNIPTPPPVTAIDKTTILQQLGNAPITIIPASKSRTKSSTEPVSLLKSNNPHLVVSGEPSATSLKRKLSVDSKSKAVIGKPDAAQGNKIIKLDETIVLPGSKTPSLVPPELISINAKQNVTITSIPSTKTQTLTLQSQPVQQQSLLQPQQSLLQPQTSNKKSPGTSGAREIIKLPDQLTEAERRETSKPWRPTLIPITPGSSEAIKAGPLYQTADGRRLPKLVQVMSGGKPYHISINDYNRMCILRREKLLQQQLLQQQIHQHQKRMQQQSPPNPTKAPKSSETTIGSAKMVQIPNQILEQNSLIPINNTGNNGSGNTKSNGPNSELQQLIRTRKPNSNSNLMPTAVSSAAATAFFKNTLSMNAASKALSLPNSTSLFSMSLQNQQQQHPPNASSPTTPSQLDQLIKSNNQFLSSFVSQSQLSAMVAQAAAAAAANSGNPMLSAGTSGGSILMDNSAAQLLSKIPKSLTVIPQQKQRSLSRVSSNEDQSSA